MANTDNHSPKYDRVLYYYRKGLWNDEMVRNAVVKGWINEEEYALITGHPYQSAA